MATRRRISWGLAGLAGMTAASIFFLASTTRGEITADELLKLLQGAPGAKLETGNGSSSILYGLAVAAMTAQTAVIGVLWRSNQRKDVKLREADASTLKEAKEVAAEAAKVREQILGRLESINRSNAEWRQKGIAAVDGISRAQEALAREIRELKDHCRKTGEGCRPSPFAAPGPGGEGGR